MHYQPGHDHYLSATHRTFVLSQQVRTSGGHIRRNHPGEQGGPGYDTAGHNMTSYVRYGRTTTARLVYLYTPTSRSIARKQALFFVFRSDNGERKGQNGATVVTEVECGWSGVPLLLGCPSASLLVAARHASAQRLYPRTNISVILYKF